MRIEPFGVGSYVHVIKRGARGLPITKQQSDKWRFLRLLYYMNDEFLDQNWDNYTKRKDLFKRLDSWPERKPIVSIIAFTLMPNHMHVALRENREGGISKFMQRIGQAMTNYHNEKYKEHGSLFQGSYRSHTIADDRYMQYVAAYIAVKNVFELYPNGGLSGARENFENAWKWALQFPFSSLADYVHARNFPILDGDVLNEILPPPQEFKIFAHDVIKSGKWLQEEFE